MRYRRKNAVVEAVQVVNSNFAGAHPNAGRVKGVVYNSHMRTATIPQWVCHPMANVGDWIVTSADGTLGVCSREFFDKTYRPAYVQGGTGLMSLRPYTTADGVREIELVVDGDVIATVHDVERAHQMVECWNDWQMNQSSTRKDWRLPPPAPRTDDGIYDLPPDGMMITPFTKED